MIPVHTRTARRHRVRRPSPAVLIGAQSVPTASLLPCFGALPRGWEIETVDISHAGTTIRFDSDRAGNSAARFRYAPSCDIGEATPSPTEFERTRRYDWILEVQPRFRERRFYRFEGGCATWDFDFDHDVTSAMALELGNSLQLLDRATVNDDLHRSFVDEDL